MITSNDVKTLQGLTDRKPQLTKLEGTGLVLLHARWFVLEVPVALLASDLATDDPPVEARIAWRTSLPAGEGEYPQAARWVAPEDQVPIVKLIAGCGVAFIHPAIYDLVMKQLPEPEFRVFEGERPHVAILSSGTVVGAVAQLKV